MKSSIEHLTQPAVGDSDFTGQVEHMIKLLNVHAHGIRTFHSRRRVLAPSSESHAWMMDIRLHRCGFIRYPQSVISGQFF